MNQHLAFVAETLETAEVINSLVRTNLRDGGYLLAEFRNFGGSAGEHAAAKLFVAAPKLLEALRRLVADFESEIHNEYDGTSMLESRLAECDYARAAIRAATE